jgi:hypothetical protein
MLGAAAGQQPGQAGFQGCRGHGHHDRVPGRDMACAGG